MPGDVAHRARTVGIQGLQTAELLALGLARREEDAAETLIEAQSLLRMLGSVQRLAAISPAILSEKAGFDRFEGDRFLALIELGRRIELGGKGPVDEIEGPEDVEALFAHLRTEKKEHFCIVMLDAKNRVLRTETVHIGTLTMSVVGPREVFRSAVREGASALILVHNHPSGDPTPSPEDIDVTRKLRNIGTELDIAILDHIIIGDNGGDERGQSFVSFQRNRWFS